MPSKPWPIPDPIPGEDRAFGGGLFIDMVPRTSWGMNLSSRDNGFIPNSRWLRLSAAIRERAGRRCEFCSAPEMPEERYYLYTHERWDYDEARAVQTLRRFIATCPACDAVTHLGRTGERRGPLAVAEALVHLTHVTGISMDEVREQRAKAMEDFERRSQIDWSFDLSVAEAAGILENLPDKYEERIAEVDASLAYEDELTGHAGYGPDGYLAQVMARDD